MTLYLLNYLALLWVTATVLLSSGCGGDSQRMLQREKGLSTTKYLVNKKPVAGNIDTIFAQPQDKGQFCIYERRVSMMGHTIPYHEPEHNPNHKGAALKLLTPRSVDKKDLEYALLSESVSMSKIFGTGTYSVYPTGFLCAAFILSHLILPKSSLAFKKVSWATCGAAAGLFLTAKYHLHRGEAEVKDKVYQLLSVHEHSANDEVMLVIEKVLRWVRSKDSSVCPSNPVTK